ncbi:MULTISPECIES: hypothetical protein [unclassified Tolypothrix]|uniref:hypothetical protein n=1 Tax=unclassified Tolypothrix TaxID=2649714 RepID=UPI0005EAAA07|nr:MULTISPECIES: hypothetical protein [unclassified Tolypothrix]EKF02062.1 hypothetical protein FDUTEX481_07314 [Tolypothrix sp. PCC 7601]UYD35188.1 hypothetical protein HG267_05165 [Tolypothrix sp. PCC 7601]
MGTGDEEDKGDEGDEGEIPITHYPLPITHYSLLITHYPLLITHSPSPYLRKSTYHITYFFLLQKYTETL